jgi:hypothetical protein
MKEGAYRIETEQKLRLVDRVDRSQTAEGKVGGK